MSRNPYWQMAKMAFVVGFASAAGGLVVSTGYKLAQRISRSVSSSREEEDGKTVVEEQVAEKLKR